MIICIEGIDGAGKTALSLCFTDKENGRYLRFAFPDRSTPTGHRINQMLEIMPKTEREAQAKPYDPTDHWDPFVFQCLHFANRLEKVDALNKAGNTSSVVLDRYWPSGYAYGKRDGLDGDWLLECSLALPVQPSIFFLVSVPPEVAAERLKSSGKATERYDDLAGLRTVAANYRELWDRMQSQRSANQEWLVLDGTKSGPDVYKQAEDAIASAVRRGLK